MDSTTPPDGLPSNEPGELGLVVVTREGVRHSGVVVDTTATSVFASLPARTHVALCIAEPLQLEFAGANPNEASKADARLISSRLEDDECHLRLRVSEDDAKAISRARFARRSLRIGVQGNAKVKLTVPGQEAEPLNGILQDVSESGMAVLVDFATDRELVQRQAKAAEGDWCLGAEFQLTGNERPLALVVKVRYRSLASANVKYGLELDRERTLAAFPGEQPRMTEHLLRYQAALLGSARRSA